MFSQLEQLVRKLWNQLPLVFSDLTSFIRVILLHCSTPCTHREKNILSGTIDTRWLTKHKGKPFHKRQTRNFFWNNSGMRFCSVLCRYIVAFRHQARPRTLMHHFFPAGTGLARPDTFMDITWDTHTTHSVVLINNSLNMWRTAQPCSQKITIKVGKYLTIGTARGSLISNLITSAPVLRPGTVAHWVWRPTHLKLHGYFLPFSSGDLKTSSTTPLWRWKDGKLKSA